MREAALADLLAEVRACRLCADLPLGPNPIVQAGESARILIAGQAPGRITHGKGRPFDDPSGERLRDWMGITRETFYDPSVVACVPMGFCFPGKMGSGDAPPKALCAQTWRARILAMLPQVKLTLVIGQYAHTWHFAGDDRPLTARVRAWGEQGGQAQGPIVPLPHPSPRNGAWLKSNPWFEMETLPALRRAVHSAVHSALGN